MNWLVFGIGIAYIARALGVDLVDLLETRLLAGSTETELLARG